MRNFFVISTILRGIVCPPEPLDKAGQIVANLEAYNDAQAAYRAVRYERDPPLTEEQRWIEELGRRTLPKQKGRK